MLSSFELILTTTILPNAAAMLKFRPDALGRTIEVPNIFLNQLY